jgi:hypothetical protein
VQNLTRDWRDGLRDFAADLRLAAPWPEPGLVDAAWNAERSILGAALATRLAEIESIRVTRRAGDGSTDAPIAFEADPVIVVTTSPAGIAATHGLLDHGGDLPILVGDRLVAVTEREYRLWCIRHPDVGHRLHVNLWNWLKTRVPPQRWPEFAPHSLAEGEAFWLHREGMAGAGALDHRGCRLWKWNGRHAALLEASVPETRFTALGDGHAG